jgi:hypothetical protein
LFSSGVSWYGAAAQAFSLSVGDPRKGETCIYRVLCSGFGVSFRGTPSLGQSPPITWDDGQECSDCRQFEGVGSAISLATQFGPAGYTYIDRLNVPNGPSLELGGYSWASFNVGAGLFQCRFSR